MLLDLLRERSVKVRKAYAMQSGKFMMVSACVVYVVYWTCCESAARGKSQIEF